MKRVVLIGFSDFKRRSSSAFMTSCTILPVSRAIDVNFFKAVTLYNSAATAEVMTHPGLPEGLDPAKTRLIHQRKLELEALCNERTQQYFKDAAIKLVHYGKL